MPAPGNLRRKKRRRYSRRPALLGQRLGIDLFGRALRLGTAGLALTGMTAGAKVIWREYRENKLPWVAAVSSHLPWTAKIDGGAPQATPAQAGGPLPGSGRFRIGAPTPAVSSLFETSAAAAVPAHQPMYPVPARATYTAPAVSSLGVFVPTFVASVPAVSRQKSVVAAPASSTGISARVAPASAVAGSFIWAGLEASELSAPSWGLFQNWTNNTVPGATANANIFYTSTPSSATATKVDTNYTINSLTFQGTSGGAAADTPSYNLTGSTGVSLTINGGGITDDSANPQTVSLPVILGANQNWTVSNAAGNLTVAGAVSGNNGLTKLGAGTLTLSGANTYTGGTTLIMGALDLCATNNALGTGTLIINGGTISNNYIEPGTPFVETVLVDNPVILNANLTQGPSNDGGLVFTGPMYLNGTHTVTTNTIAGLDGPISGAPGAGLTLTNAPQLYLDGNTVNTYTGTTTVDGGRVFLTKENGAVAIPGDLLIRNGGTVYDNGNQLAATSNVTILTGGNFFPGNEKLASLSGDSSGTVTLSYQQTPVTLTVGGGQCGVLIQDSPAPPPGSPGTFYPSTLVKNGSGTLSLTNNNTYSGGTTVTGGTLLVNNVPVNGVGSGTGTGFVQVNNGAQLSGNGQIAGPVTVGTVSTGMAAVLAPGNNAPDLLTLTSSLTLDNSAQLDITLDGVTAGAGGYSQLLVAGEMILGGDLDVILADGFKPVYGQTFYIIDDTGSTSPAGSFLNTPGGLYTDAMGNQYLVNYAATDPNMTGGAIGTDVSLMAVPEPGSLVIAVAGLAVGAVVAHRRLAAA